MSELSEEEILKILKHVIEPVDIEHMSFYEIYKDYVPLPKLNEAIQGLLNIYQKEKQKNEELEEENHEIRQWKYAIDTIEDLDRLKELDLIKIKGKEYISKDKIRELIKDINEETQYLGKDRGETKQHYAVRKIIELLEERN